MLDRNPYKELATAVGDEGYERVKTFTLPASGSVILFGPEIDVVRTAEFQRLAGIKQLGTSYVVYRGALHTRFEHSLGSLHQADLMLRKVASNPRDPYPVDNKALRLARLGALLHDLPHVPFGHTLEDEFHLLKRHDENARRIRRLLVKSQIGRILTEALGPDEFAELQNVLSAKKDVDFGKLEYPFVGDVVGNTVCADLLDYVERDLLSCGLPAALGDRFLDYLSVTHDDEGLPVDHRRLVLNLDKRGMPRPDVESEVVKLLTLRYELAERVYFHHAKNAASVMIGRAVQEAGWAVGPNSPAELDDNFLWLSDEMLLAGLADVAIEKALGIKSEAGTGDRSLAAALAQSVRQRDLYKIAYLATWDDIPDAVGRVAKLYEDPEDRRTFEDELADAAGVKRGHVLVHVPRQKMMTKDADVRVRTARREVLKLHEWDENHSRRLRALNEAHLRLWRVMVFVHPADEKRAVSIVRALAEDHFRAPSRYVPRNSVSSYEREVFRSLDSKWELEVADEAALASAAYVGGAGTKKAQENAILGAIRQARRDRGAPPLSARSTNQTSASKSAGRSRKRPQ